MSSSRNVTLLTWFGFFSALKFYGPIQIVYFAVATGSYALAGGLMMTVQLVAALTELPTGIFSDHAGRRLTVLSGALAMTLAVALYASRLSYAVLLLGAVCEGFSRSLFSGNNDAYLYDSLHADGRASDYRAVYSRVNRLSTLSLFISSIGSGILAALSLDLLMLLTLAAQLISAVFAFRLRDLAPPHTEKLTPLAHVRAALAGLRRSPRLRLLSLSSILSEGIGATAYQYQSAVFHALWPLWAVGLARALGEALAVLGFHWSEGIIRRVGQARLILVSTIYSWLANLLPALFPSPITPLLIPTSTLLYGPTTSAVEALKQRDFSPPQRATMASLNALGASLFHALLMLGFGVIADRIGPITTLALIQVVFIAVIVVDVRLYRLLRAQPDTRAQ